MLRNVSSEHLANIFHNIFHNKFINRLENYKKLNFILNLNIISFKNNLENTGGPKSTKKRK